MGLGVRRLSRVTGDGSTSSLEQNPEGQLRKLYDVRPTPSEDMDEIIVDLILDLEEWWSTIADEERSRPDTFTHLNGDQIAEFFAAVEGDQGADTSSVSTSPHQLLRPDSLLTAPPQVIPTPTTSFSGGSLSWSGNFFPQFQAQAPPPEVKNITPTFAQPHVPARWPRGQGRQRRQPLPVMPLAPLQDICPLPDVQIKPEIWAKALMEIFSDDNGKVNSASLADAAKVLLKSLFSKEEVKSCTFSGRHGSKELDPNRIKAIKVAVSLMKANKRDGVDPYSFTPTAPDLTPEEVRIIEKQVFIGRRHALNKAKPMSKAVRRRCASSSDRPFTSSRQVRRRNATVAGAGSRPLKIEDEVQGIIDMLGDDDENPGA